MSKNTFTVTMASTMHKDTFTVGIIGMGDMGKMYARRLSDAGWRVNACDKEDNYEKLCGEFGGKENVTILKNGHLVSRISDYIIYNVEAAAIGKVVAQYAPSTKANAIVGGQTSCKTPEIDAFDKYMPLDVDIVSCHSLHGPKIDPKDQPLVIIQHRDNHGDSLAKVVEVLSCLESEVVYLSKDEHDRITADTQAVTHVAFLSMGKAWHANRQFPWEIARYVGGIENVKINLTLRIYSQKWHVYAGLAILNPQAKKQIEQYAKSVTLLYKLMLGGHRKELEKRIKDAGSKVFRGQPVGNGEKLLLQDSVLDRFALGKKPEVQTPNNHLSLLAMVHCWAELDIVPYRHLICSTPLFRMWLGVTEYLFLKPGLLDEAIRIAIEDNTFRDDDLEFLLAARGWSDCVRFGDFDAYRDRFEQTREFFEPRFEDATKVGNEMIKTILDKTKGETK